MRSKTRNKALPKWFSGLHHAALLVPLLVSTTTLAAAETVDLRGYGKVTAELTPRRAVFACESIAKADILLGKLLADLFWDADANHVEKSVPLRGAAVTLHIWPPYGAMIAARAGTRVMLVAGADEAALLKSAAAEPLLLGGDVVFKPAKPYPVYLDTFDLRAYKAYAHPMSSKNNFGLESHWPFLKRFGFGGEGFQTLGVNTSNPQPGVNETTGTDYEFKEAERQGGLLLPSITAGGIYPLWVYNQYPDAMLQVSPTALFNQESAAGGHFESLGMPLETMAATGLAHLQQMMRRYLNSPALGGWGLYSGEPGAEMAFHDRCNMYYDYSPASHREFRTWLREVRGFSLAEMSRRWYGDSKHLTGWDQIALPDINDFYGGPVSGGVRLADNWQFQATDKAAATPPAANDAKWISFAMPPSQQRNFLPAGPSFYRTTFSGANWQKPGQEVYLAVLANNSPNAKEGISIWLNGQMLGKFQPDDNSIGGVQVKIGELIKPGANELAIKVPSETPNAGGRIVGPVYLCPKQPKFYPYMGKELNARYADLRLFQVYGMLRIHQPVVETARALDPDRPLFLSPGSSIVTADAAAQLAVRYGAGLQNTGRDAYTFPYWAGYGYVGGFYGTSEPAGNAQGAKLDRMFGMIHFDGDGSHTLFWDIENYMKQEQETGWFTRHARQIQLFGKALRDNPRLVLYRSSRDAVLGSSNFSKLDIGNSDMQAAHYDNVYANDSDVLSGRIDRFPVLMDTGDDIMQPDIVDALTRYVKNGGTFVATHITGRHSLEEVDSYPIASLVGATLKNANQRGKLRFSANLPMLNAYAGRDFEAGGIALTPPPGANPLVPLATWEDGSLAIGVRELGKGRVIVLGSGFWRNNDVRDRFYDQFFADLGITRTATSTSSTVWAHKFVTKNGLQDWVIAFNTTDAAQTVDVAYKAAAKPSVVWNLTTRQPVEHTYTGDGWVHIAQAEIAPQSIAVFGSPRGSLLDGLPIWWGEKTKYWKHSDAVAPVAPAAPRENLPMTQWRFAADPDGKLSGSEAWIATGFADGGWKSAPSGLWDIIFDDRALRQYRGVALYRNTFTVPTGWKGHRIALNLYSYDTPIVYDDAEFYLNGKLVTTYQAHGGYQHYNYDVTGLLRPGTNVLAVKVTGGKQFAGIAGPVWLQMEQKLAPALDLAGPWTAVKQDYLTEETIQLPGVATARYLARNVAVPAAWANKTVYLHVETERQWMASVVVNGHAINVFGLAQFPLRADVNITPYLKPGQDNRIEFWPNATIPGFFYKNTREEEKVDVVLVRMGCI